MYSPSKRQHKAQVALNIRIKNLLDGKLGKLILRIVFFVCLGPGTRVSAVLGVVCIKIKVVWLWLWL
jgi:hypothetical protein